MISALLALVLSAAAGDSIKIGLLIPRDGPIGLAIEQGASLAVAEANRGGGYRGRPFSLVIRSDDGPWGSGSRAVVQLIYEDGVWAILGSAGGRSAHVAEQVVAKAHVVFVSPWAGDQTLTQVNIPWFFRVVPGDDRQAEALAGEVFGKRLLRRVATISDGSYDARFAERAFAGLSDPESLLRLEAGPTLGADVLARLEDKPLDGLILFAPAGTASGWVRQLRSRGVEIQIFGSLALSVPSFRSAVREAGYRGAVVAAAQGTLGAAFARAYRAAYAGPPPRAAAHAGPAHLSTALAEPPHPAAHAGPPHAAAALAEPPHPAAALAYDGMRAIIAAVRAGGTDHQLIRDALMGLTRLDGATGPIEFDGRGNRVGGLRLVDLD